jgi:hypothetical protein
MRYLKNLCATELRLCSATPEYVKNSLDLRQSVLTDTRGRKEVKVAVLSRPPKHGPVTHWTTMSVRCLELWRQHRSVLSFRGTVRGQELEDFTARWARWVCTMTCAAHCSLTLFSVLHKRTRSKSPKTVTFPTSILEVPYSNLALDTNYPQFFLWFLNLSNGYRWIYHEV